MKLNVIYYDYDTGIKYNLNKTINVRVIAKNSPDLLITRTDIMPSSQANPGDQVEIGRAHV